MSWKDYIGLPHETGADPVDMKGADCLLLAYRVWEELGIKAPPPDPSWFLLARRGAWDDLRALFAEMTEPTSRRDGAVALMGGEAGEMGVGISIGGGVLLCSLKVGVLWLPDKVTTFHQRKDWYLPRP